MDDAAIMYQYGAVVAVKLRQALTARCRKDRYLFGHNTGRLNIIFDVQNSVDLAYNRGGSSLPTPTFCVCVCAIEHRLPHCRLQRTHAPRGRRQAVNCQRPPALLAERRLVIIASEEGRSTATMVTRIVTRRIISSGKRKTAVAAKDSNQEDVNRLKDNNNRQDDDKKHDGKHAVQDDRLCSFQGCQNKTADGGNSYSYHDVFFNDDTTHDDGKAVDIQRDSSTRKRPLLSDDVDDNEKKKHRKRVKCSCQCQIGRPILILVKGGDKSLSI
eukprot:scaffold10688_cov144-Skeletonema_dohrnii-CCMP3373.AAC.3